MAPRSPSAPRLPAPPDLLPTHNVLDCSAAATDIAGRPCETDQRISPEPGLGTEMTRKNRNLLLAVAPLALALGAPALGADMLVKARLAPMVVPYSWTGWYIGANAG
jgi:hypothetical protein